MTRMPKTFGLIALMVLATGLSACRSSSSKCTGPNCAPPTEQAPSFADVEPSYPPAAPSYSDVPAIESQPAPTVSKAQLDAARDSADLARRQSEELARRLATEEDERRAQDKRIADMARKIDDLENPPAGVSPEPDMSVPEITQIDRLIQELRARSSADVVRDGNMVIIRVTNGFKSGSDLLKKDVQLISTLNAAADALRRYDGADVSVVGHSDGDPIKKSSWKDNTALSLARAERVASVLRDNGVAQKRITIDGQGFRSPLIPQERSRSDKATNRRVEIMIRMGS